VDALPSPIPGLRIAVAPKTGGLIGIDRAKREIVFGKVQGAGANEAD
jgi:hypothetical protein